MQTLTKAKWVTFSLLSLAAISLLNAATEPESDGTTAISTQLSATLFVLNLFSATQVSSQAVSHGTESIVAPINRIEFVV